MKNIIQLDEVREREKNKNNQDRICVVGGGVIGLTCALVLARLGYHTRVISNQLIEKVTSYASAAFWFPVLVGSDPRVWSIAAKSLAVFAKLSKDRDTGVRPAKLRVCYTQARQADLAWRAIVPTTAVSQVDLPAGCECGYDAEVYRMQMETYLPYLKSECERFGVKFEKENVLSLETLPDEVVINCSGVYARNLVNDLSVEPIRGQVVLVEKPELDRAKHNFDVLIVEGFLPNGHERLDYIVSRDSDCLLGGTADRGDWSLTPRFEQREQILQNCAGIMPELNSSAVLCERVGLRPFRPTLRLETELLRGGPSIIHAYGHGGSGVTLSWGTADAVLEMVARLATRENDIWRVPPKPRLKAA